MLLFVETSLSESVETRGSSDLTALLKSLVQRIGKLSTSPPKFNLSAKESQFDWYRIMGTAVSALKECGKNMRKSFNRELQGEAQLFVLFLCWAISGITRFPAATEFLAQEKHYCYCNWEKLSITMNSTYLELTLCLTLYAHYSI